MTEVQRTLSWPGDDSERAESLITREWLVTNGLGGYASGTVSGVLTRGFHGFLVAALPSPWGRVMMLNHVVEIVELEDGSEVQLGAEERAGAAVRLHGSDFLSEFRLDLGLPVWRYELKGATIEKSLVMPRGQNTVYVTYRLAQASGPVRLRLRPLVRFRPHNSPVTEVFETAYSLGVLEEDEYEVIARDVDLPPLRFLLCGEGCALVAKRQKVAEVLYRIEESRGYAARSDLFSPGEFRLTIEPGREAALVASTEERIVMRAMTPEEAFDVELNRRRRLLAEARDASPEGTVGELVLAADQFIIVPRGRVQDTARARAAGDEVRSVIAGYHWFTDWGRDTMISLEGLTLVTGRHVEASYILKTFAHYVRDGLIPNLFPEGKNEGLYHTADATLWFFHAVDRYLEVTGDRALLRRLLPVLLDIVDHHLRGTRFGIGVDPSDGLLRQGAEGYQLTWMDAKVDGWVVTPRRGKAVELNGLWYNALRLLSQWLVEEGRTAAVSRIDAQASKLRASFNERFWNASLGCLYDVVDTEGAAADPAVRPNQLLAFSLRNPVLEASRWAQVLAVVEANLVTPVGLRSLAPGHPDYKPRYDGDLRSRDAAYHQGTVWSWLIGPFIDAWLKVHPDRAGEARRYLDGFLPHLGEACLGTVSEIFDAEAPYSPRGCAAQAWGVAELLRCWVKVTKAKTDGGASPA